LDTKINVPLMQNAELRAEFLAKIFAGRWGQPAELARLALFLCPEDAGYIPERTLSLTVGGLAQ
jgi:NAD(P)-dependent dehydrogenase (short-subunit alcohol dehydrogenase family)